MDRERFDSAGSSNRAADRPLSVTLDTNCIIDLEEHRTGHEDVLRLLDLHKRKRLAIRLVAVSAAEKRLNGMPVENFVHFQDYVRGIGLDDLDILKPLGVFGYSFFDWCLFAGPDMTRLYHDIGRILFPLAWREVPENGRPSHNQICDAIVMWAHIWHRGQIFVTRDGHFLAETSRSLLERRGAGRITTSSALVAELGAE